MQNLIEINKTEDLFPDEEIKGQKFNLQSKMIFLTYKTHLNKEILTNYFKIDFWSKIKAKDVYIAHENGDDNHPYPHTHVFLDFSPKRLQSKDPRCFDIYDDDDIEILHPHIKRVNSSNHMTNIYKYLCKEDHSNDFLLALIPKFSIAEKVWSKPTLQDALKDCQSVNEVIGMERLYGLRPKPEIEFKVTGELRTWQKNVLKHLQSTPNRRTIFWFWEPEGNTGKSWFIDWYQDNIDPNILVIQQFGGMKDIATVIETASENGWSGNPIFIDLPRDAETHSIYAPLEAFKNGRINSVKYKGRIMRWKPGHVIVFANFPPNYTKLSKDRWYTQQIKLLDCDKSITPDSTEPDDKTSPLEDEQNSGVNRLFDDLIDDLNDNIDNIESQ